MKNQNKKYNVYLRSTKDSDFLVCYSFKTLTDLLNFVIDFKPNNFCNSIYISSITKRKKGPIYRNLKEINNG